MITSLFVAAMSLIAQNPQGNPFQQGPPPQGGPGGQMGRPGGPMNQETIKILKTYDHDKDGMLNLKERVEARAALKERTQNRPQGGFRGPGGGGPGGPGGMRVAGSPGPRVSQSSAKLYPGIDLYDPKVLRTVFIEFEESDWEDALQEFHNTDVDVPATITVDGTKLKNVGVRFRGASSYMMIPAGSKRSLNVSVDMVDSKQRLLGYKTLNLLNSNGDPSFMSSVLYSRIANHFIPAPRANHVKVVVNGESWGVYVNVEQFNNDFVARNFKDTLDKDKAGARWKVSGSPQGDGGLRYLGDAVAQYKQRFEIKSKDNVEDWNALIKLCKTLDTTPPDQLEGALKPKLDIDGALKFLALDIVLMNSDGYWTRASDYSLYKDPKGVFHVIPHDMNESFRAGGGPGGPGGRGGRGPGMMPPGGPGMPPPNGGQGGPVGPPPGGPGGFQPQGPPPQGGFGQPAQGGNPFALDPLNGLQDARKPLRSKLLAVPSLRARYLGYVKKIAEEHLNWSKVAPFIEQTRQLLDAEIKADTRKLSTYDAFVASMSAQAEQPTAQQPRMGGANLKRFFDMRRDFLLKYQEPSGNR